MTSASNPSDHTPPRPELDTELALRHILEGTAAETGGGFFAALVQHLCEALGTDSAWVTEWLPLSRRLNIVAFWHNGRLAPNREYDVTGTPCELVVEENRLVVIPEDVMSKFSNDPDLPEMGAVSYIGVPLTDVDGRIMGHLAVQDSREMTDDERIPAVFQIFAARAAAELQRLRAECEVREREEKLERLVDSALDAIVELDAQLRITRINSAAEGVFVITADQVSGRDFGILVDRASRSKLERLCAELERLPAGKRYVWISGGLNGRRSDAADHQLEPDLVDLMDGDEADLVVTQSGLVIGDPTLQREQLFDSDVVPVGRAIATHDWLNERRC